MDVSKYNFECQKALHFALQYARSFGHQSLEVEHAALGLLRLEYFKEANFDVESLRKLIFYNLNNQARTYGKFKISFGKRINASLDAAEARAASQNQTVDEEILWLELKKQSTTLQNLLQREEKERKKSEDFEVGFGDVKDALTKNINNPKFDKADDKPVKKSSVNQPKIDRKLQKFTTDLSELAERGELDPVIGRDEELRRLMEILGRKKKNNPILLGEPGVGKSAVVEALALKIASGKVPETMLGLRVLTLDLGALLAGAKYRGEFEERLKSLMDTIQNLKGQIILFIDEIHMIVGAGNNEGAADAANLLKPALARGDIKCIGATTWDEFRKYIEKDPALERRFQAVIIEEPSRENTISILRGLKLKYELHHGVKINEEAIIASVDLSVRYLNQRRLPDKAIDLIDEAASRVKLQVESIPRELEELKSQIENMELARKALKNEESKSQKQLTTIAIKLESLKKEAESYEQIWNQYKNLMEQKKSVDSKIEETHLLLERAKQESNFELASHLQHGQVPALKSEELELNKAMDRLQEKHSFLRRDVGAKEVAEVLALWVKVPVAKLLNEESTRLLTLEQRLGKRVLGQSEAITALSFAVQRARLGIQDPMRPMGVFLFVGPTGVGKTELAKALAEELFEDESKMIRVDMSEFMEAHSVARFVGAPPGYVGYGEGGELTEQVRKRPYSVVLLDEIEKAHPKVLDILLAVFDDGRLTDGSGVTVDFRNTLIILTSNLPIHNLVSRQSSNRVRRERDLRQHLIEYLRPELVNRLDDVILFENLNQDHLTKLVVRYLDELNLRLSERDLRITLGKNIQKQLIKDGSDPKFGGRQMRRSFQRLVIDALSSRLLLFGSSMKGVWVLDMDPESNETKWMIEHKNDYYLPAQQKKGA